MREIKFKRWANLLIFIACTVTFQFIAMPKLLADSFTIEQTGKTIKGKIIDSSGSPLPGANVTVKGTTRGVISDIDGYYVINAEKGEVLVFSFIGFQEQTVTIGDKTAIDVIMKEETTLLDEAVVVGMGTQRKASVIGAISSVEVDQLRIPQRSLTSALSGRIAGATIVQRSGEPGYDDASFWVRGISSFGANQTPLILVDGVERNMNNIPVEEVESISLLKDASATAVYGVRAANGVVLITTRKGAAQKPIIEAKVEYGISDLPNMPKFVDGGDYARLYNEAFGREHYSEEFIEYTESGVNRFLWPNVNWFDQIFKKWSDNTNASVTIKGGGEKARYFINAGFLEENGNLRNYNLNDYKSNINLKRYNFRSNIDMTLTKSTVLNLELGANLIDAQEPGVGNRTLYSTHFNSPTEELFYWAYLVTPISAPIRIPIEYKEDGSVEKWGWGSPSQIGEMNPAERLLGSGYRRRYSSEIMSQVILNQDLSFLLPGLKFRGFFSFDTYNNTLQNRFKTSSTYAVEGVDDETGRIIPKEINKGTEYLGYATYSSSRRAVEAKAQLNYDNLFAEKHRVGGMLMYYQRDYINGSAGEAIFSLPYRKQGLAFRATYAYRDTYFAEFNMGYNGSENFPKENRFGLFPAVALGYLISNEPFWNIDAIDVLKFRGSIGLVGSDVLPRRNNQEMRYGYLSTWKEGLGGYYFGFHPNFIPGVGEDQIGIYDLTWEKGLKKDIGIELKMFKNAISLEFDLFHENRTDILIERKSLPSIIGFNAAPFANMGTMVNHGIETTLELSHKFNDLYCKLYGNFTFARNKITEMDEPKREFAYRMRTGQRYGQQFGLIALGLFKDQEEIDSSPAQKFGPVRPGDVKYQDLNDDNVIDANDEMPIGYSYVPEITYGFGTQFLWRGFDLGLFFRGQANVSYALGGSTFIPFDQGVGKGNVFEKALDRWTPENPNPNAFYPRHSDGRSTNNWQRSSRNIYDGSLLRLSNFELGYTFGKKLFSHWGIEGLRIYVLANNVLLFSKWNMWDPETGTMNGNRYPQPRKINFGIRTTF